MRILDDLNNEKISIDNAISALSKAKEQGDTVVKVGYILVGYEQAMVIETAKE